MWFVLGALFFALAPAAQAKSSVFLNGVNIDGVTGQTFKNVNVQLDAHGNVLITAKGYEVQTVGSAPTSPTPKATRTAGPVTKKYFLVSETNAPGMTQYDVDVYINSRWIKRISGDDAQSVLEITRHLKKGKNIIHFTATKTMGDARKSTSRGNYLKLIIGEGNIGGSNVMIDNPLIEYTRTAAEVKQTITEEFQVTAR